MFGQVQDPETLFQNHSKASLMDQEGFGAALATLKPAASERHINILFSVALGLGGGKEGQSQAGVWVDDVDDSTTANNANLSQSQFLAFQKLLCAPDVEYQILSRLVGWSDTSALLPRLVEYCNESKRHWEEVQEVGLVLVHNKSVFIHTPLRVSLVHPSSPHSSSATRRKSRFKDQ